MFFVTNETLTVKQRKAGIEMLTADCKAYNPTRIIEVSHNRYWKPDSAV